MTTTILTGDCRDVLRGMAEASVDAIVTDPPYHLTQVSRGGSTKLGSKGFMGKTWDGGDVAFDPETWAEALRVLKPGGYLLAFGGARTYHRMACAIEDAGFELRDQIMWLYGSGFPKSKNIGDGRGTALKPAHEPIVLSRKPLVGTVAANVQAFGTGALNIDGCRVETSDALKLGKTGLASQKFFTKGDARPIEKHQHPAGRWPANVIHDGSDEVEAAFAAFGSRGAAAPVRGTEDSKASTGRVTGSRERVPGVFHGDTGTAARFFMACKSSEGELLFSHAKATMQAWNNVLANTADNASSLSSELAASALSDVATWASQGATRLSDVTGLSTTVTPSELSRISESVIAAILSLDGEHSPDPLQDGLILNGCRVTVAAIQKRTDTTTITISHWKSDGSAAPVTFSITPLNSEHGARGLNGSDRFRYCAKASRADRGDGLDGLPVRKVHGPSGDGRCWDIPGSKSEPRANHHPTVKPTELMRYLCRLITPPGGTVLDPFAGSGSTGRGALLEGFNFVGIELSPEYADIAERRIGVIEQRLAA